MGDAITIDVAPSYARDVMERAILGCEPTRKTARAWTFALTLAQARELLSDARYYSLGSAMLDPSWVREHRALVRAATRTAAKLETLID